MRKTLTDKGVSALKPRAVRYALPDPELRGHYVRVQPSGQKSFVAVSRDPVGRQVWTTIGACDLLDIEVARHQAREVISRVRAGLPAFDVPKATPETFAAVAENYVKRHVVASGLRSRYAIERILGKYVLPRWRDRSFVTIRRSDVASLLDEVQDDHGARQADYVLAVIRGMMNWFATRHDDYAVPIVRGMRRQGPKAHQRARILDDDEIRRIWLAAKESGTFGAIVRTALLTAQRREKVAAMKWTDIVDGEWIIATAEREKGSAGSLVLPKLALDTVTAQPQLGSNEYVFAGRGAGHFNGWSKAKVALDAKANVTDWVLHDLRRTSRSLMSRAGVLSEIGERVMGHAIVGVEGIYDRHSYREEKRDALLRLSTLLEGIINPRQNVVRIQPPPRKARRAVASHRG